MTLFHWLLQQRPAPLPTRVGLLDSGELVLLSPHDQAQVLSIATTERIRSVLAASARPAALRPLAKVGTE